jgi:uncharacterized protein involved in type VI secretion and phage assembly
MKISDTTVDGAAARHFGVYPAIVEDVVDPDRLGRIQVSLPSLGTAGAAVRAWATLCTPYADDDQGIQVLPSKGTQVVVAFEAGELSRPYIVGACWNGKEALPVTPEAANNKRVWRSRAKSVLEFDDTAGAAKVTLKMASGHTLVLDDLTDEVRLTHKSGSTITMNLTGQIVIDAATTVEVSALALSVHAPVAAFDGIVSCTTVIASSGVVSPAYTPGAGNIW